MSRKAFTLIELLVVIAIIGALIGLLLPAVQKVRAAAARAQCVHNLKQIALAGHNYHDTYHYFPPGYSASGAYVDGASDTTPGWGWAAYLLPYIEQNSLFRAIDFGQPVESPGNAAVIQTMIALYVCPSDLAPIAPFPVADAFGNTIALAAPSSYAACVGGDESDAAGRDGLGIFSRNSRTRMTDVTDGTSSTILIAERAWSNAQGIWAGAINHGVIQRGKQNPNPGNGAAAYPATVLVQLHCHLNNAATDTDGGLDDPSSNHTGGSNFAFADGSVHFIRSIPGDAANGSFTAEGLAFQALGTRANNDLSQGLDY
jgi:prepilin-type N-terminal cleavage/methylation domain-containing protein/prepilin-type processing-associated H-X9-DG protein